MSQKVRCTEIKLTREQDMTDKNKQNTSTKFTLECLLYGKGPRQVYRVPVPCVYVCEQFQKYDITNGVHVIPERMPCPHGGYCHGSRMLLDGKTVEIMDLGNFRKQKSGLQTIDPHNQTTAEVRFIDKSHLTAPANTWSKQCVAKSTCDFRLQQFYFGALYTLRHKCPIVQELEKTHANVVIMPHLDSSYDVFVPHADSKVFSAFLTKCHTCICNVKKNQK